MTEDMKQELIAEKSPNSDAYTEHPEMAVGATKLIEHCLNKVQQSGPWPIRLSDLDVNAYEIRAAPGQTTFQVLVTRKAQDRKEKAYWSDYLKLQFEALDAPEGVVQELQQYVPYI